MPCKWNHSSYHCNECCHLLLMMCIIVFSYDTINNITGLSDHKDINTTAREIYTKIHRNANGIEPCSPSNDGPSSPCSYASASEGNSGCQFLDILTQRAYEKMIKLDQKLAKLNKREKEVKKQRKLLKDEMEMGFNLALSTQSPRDGESIMVGLIV